MYKTTATNQTEWEWEIKPQTTWYGSSLKEIISYKDLLYRLVRKDFLTSYQQTLLGPAWIFLQPILTVITYVLVFNRVIGLSTDGIPSFLYYLIGITLWGLFSDLFLIVSNAFTVNAAVFNKIYFPRIIIPISLLLVNGLRFLIQLVLLLIVLMYYYFIDAVDVQFSNLLLCIPAVIITAGIALGAGLIFSIFSAKYKDLLNLISILIRLFMFLCPIFYSLSMVPEKIKWLVNINPLASQFELFRFGFIGKGEINPANFMYSTLFMLVVVIAGVFLFNKKNEELMDIA